MPSRNSTPQRPASRARSAASTPLPWAWTRDPLIGRSDELLALERRFARGQRLVTLTGMGGIGKTRLAVEYLGRPSTGERGFCSLADVRGEDEVCSAVATALLGAAPRRARHRRAADEIAALLSRGRIFLVLDNAEHIADEVAGLVTRWLSSAHDVRFLVTSREPLGVRGEVVVELGPLPFDDLATDGEAARLFWDRAQAVRPGYRPTDDDRRVIRELVRSLDGLPLAIELAAARMAVLSPKQIFERVDRPLELLVGRSRRGAARGRTLRATLDGSWELLGPFERLALAQLSVFRGGFDLEAAEAVLDLEPARTRKARVPSVSEAIEALRWSSLVTVTDTGDLLRWGLFDSIRAYADEKLERSGYAAATRSRHADHYLGASRRITSQIRGPEATAARARLRRERANLLEAHRRSCAADDPRERSLALSLLLTIDEVLRAEEPATVHLALLDAAMRAAEGGALAPAVQAGGLIARARLLARLGKPREGERTARAALRLARSTRAVDVELEAWTFLVTHHYGLGDLESALDAARQAAKVAPRASSPRLPAAIEVETAIALHLSGDVSAAEDRYRRGLELFRAAGDLDGEGQGLACLGFLHQDLGALAEAKRCYEAGLTIQRDMSNIEVEGIILGYLGNLERRWGDRAAAEARYERALAQLRRCDNRPFEAAVLMDRGLLLVEHRQYERAGEVLKEALALFGESPNGPCEALVLAALGVIAAHAGREEEARARLDAADAALRATRDPKRIAVELYRGQLEVAAAKRALSKGKQTEARRWIARAAARLSPKVRRPPSDYVAIAERLLRRALLPLLPTDEALVVTEDGASFVPPGRRRALVGRRATLRRLLVALAERRYYQPGDPLGVEALFAAGWPDERVNADAARNRVRVALTTLRKLGLGPLLESVPAGYRLAPTLELVFVTGDAQL